MTALAASQVSAQGPAPSLLLGEAEFEAWLNKAAPGERLVYHEGHLGIDRARGYSELPEPQRAELCRVAEQVLSLAAAGRLLLAQQRLARGRAAYLAVKASQGSAKRRAW